jgi:hypothetical protein
MFLEVNSITLFLVVGRGEEGVREDLVRVLEISVATPVAPQFRRHSPVSLAAFAAVCGFALAARLPRIPRGQSVGGRQLNGRVVCGRRHRLLELVELLDHGVGRRFYGTNPTLY